MGVGADAEPLERLSHLFAADTLLASQFFDMRRSASGRHPLQRLMLAVLADALDCYRYGASAHPQSRRGRLHDEAKRWINAEASGPFAFEWVCDGLGIDASYLRAGILRLGHF